MRGVFECLEGFYACAYARACEEVRESAFEDLTAMMMVNCFISIKGLFVDLKLDWQHFARGLLSLTLTS